MPPLAVNACEYAAPYGALNVAPAGASDRPGPATVSVNACPTENGPLPVLLSVADTLRLKLPACVGVPATVTLLAVVPVIDTPAGRLVTW